jgi:N-acetyl sugar amidotransferase
MKIPEIALQICSRCIYDNRISNISFDKQGVCNYCHQVDNLADEYGTGMAKGEQLLAKIIEDIRNVGKKKKYDCIIGVSGGTDSSYLLLKAKEWKLRPLAVHYDNTWNSALATMNIQKVTSALDIDLFTYVVDNKEHDDIKKSFLLAGVAEFDSDTDIAFVQVLRSTAAKYGIRYILEGHSFITEGLTPIGSNYFDGAYIADIHDRFGSKKRKTFPNLTFYQFMKWTLVYRQKFIRPLWYIDYSKESARQELITKTGWQYYGGHHLENRASAFAHTVWLPKKFKIDLRNLTLAANVRRGVMDKKTALSLYNQTIAPQLGLIDYVKKRIDISDTQYQQIMTGPIRTWRNFYTYKKRFERLRLLFYLLAKANLVPTSFYLKYCFPEKIK